MILLPAEILATKQNHTNSLCRKPFFVDVVLAGSRRSLTVSAEAIYDGQSLQEVDSLKPCDKVKICQRIGKLT